MVWKYCAHIPSMYCSKLLTPLLVGEPIDYSASIYVTASLYILVNFRISSHSVTMHHSSEIGRCPSGFKKTLLSVFEMEINR
jgi:hypothetical protein